MRGYVDGRFEDVDIDTGLVELARLTAERAAKWESVLLLGSRETIDAGREWNTIIFDLSDFASGNRRTTPAEWDECYRAAGAARDRFYECARKDLEV
ncbi:hypothetical protein E1284_27585 [Actinomadura bangladeshensis]|jgi:hypothetical protein|uniref:Uncharacterized protein n=1 Tax=Actinomadura bangladeshensis TaxID=453573 RepID=A0A4R4NUH7_9ACTN|nr:hypothetical protein E1284_27585 [Actinomadura bangladeshensis]